MELGAREFGEGGGDWCGLQLATVCQQMEYFFWVVLWVVTFLFARRHFKIFTIMPPWVFLSIYRKYNRMQRVDAVGLVSLTVCALILFYFRQQIFNYSRPIILVCIYYNQIYLISIVRPTKRGRLGLYKKSLTIKQLHI